jgi:hypothetical protein
VRAARSSRSARRPWPVGPGAGNARQRASWRLEAIRELRRRSCAARTRRAPGRRLRPRSRGRLEPGCARSSPRRPARPRSWRARRSGFPVFRCRSHRHPSRTSVRLRRSTSLTRWPVSSTGPGDAQAHASAYTAANSSSVTYRSRPQFLVPLHAPAGVRQVRPAGVTAPIPDGREERDFPVGPGRREPRLLLPALARPARSAGPGSPRCACGSMCSSGARSNTRSSMASSSMLSSRVLGCLRGDHRWRRTAGRVRRRLSGAVPLVPPPARRRPTSHPRGCRPGTRPCARNRSARASGACAAAGSCTTQVDLLVIAGRLAEW